MFNIEMIKLGAELGKCAALGKQALTPPDDAPAPLPFRLSGGEGGGAAEMMPNWMRQAFGQMPADPPNGAAAPPRIDAPRGLPFRLRGGEGGGSAELNPEFTAPRFGQMDAPPTGDIASEPTLGGTPQGLPFNLRGGAEGTGGADLNPEYGADRFGDLGAAPGATGTPVDTDYSGVGGDFGSTPTPTPQSVPRRAAQIRRSIRRPPVMKQRAPLARRGYIRPQPPPRLPGQQWPYAIGQATPKFPYRKPQSGIRAPYRAPKTNRDGQ